MSPRGRLTGLPSPFTAVGTPAARTDTHETRAVMCKGAPPPDRESARGALSRRGHTHARHDAPYIFSGSHTRSSKQWIINLTIEHRYNLTILQPREPRETARQGAAESSPRAAALSPASLHRKDARPMPAAVRAPCGGYARSASCASVGLSRSSGLLVYVVVVSLAAAPACARELNFRSM